MHFNLGLNVRHADEQLRGTMMLPHGTGREARVAVFAEGDKAREAEEAGADVVGAADLATRVQEGFTDFDVAIATPDQMGNVGRLGRILGPRGLMPNPKTGTVTFDVGKAVRDAKAGKLEYRTDRGANVHIPIGKKSFDERAARRELRGAPRRDRPREAGGRQGPLHQEDHAHVHDGPRGSTSTRRAPATSWTSSTVKRRRPSRSRPSTTARRRRQEAVRRVSARARKPSRGGLLVAASPLPRARLRAGSIRRGGGMHKEDKERVVTELTEKLRNSDTLIVADYRGLTMTQIDALRGRLLEHGARFSVVKNTLTRRAAEAAGADQLLALLEGPSAIAFIEADGDAVAVAKALADSARETTRARDQRRRHAGPEHHGRRTSRSSRSSRRSTCSADR